MKQFLLTLFAALIFIASAQAAELSPQGPFRALDGNGAPCVDCKLYTYEAGSSTPKLTYTDRGAMTSNTNPVVLDDAGYANVWLGDGSYKLILKDSFGATLWSIDQITGSSAAAFGDQVVAISANTSITTAYQNNLILTTSSPTLSPLSAATAGEGFTWAVKNMDSGTTTIDPNGAETIDGAATLTLGEKQWAIIYSDGTNWQTTDSRITNNSVTTAKIADDAVTLAKIDGDVTFANKLVGYDGSGDPANITAGSGITISSSVISATFSALKDRILNGCTLSNNVGDATNDIDIAACSAVSDDGTTVMTSTALTKRLDAAWVVGTNQGGLDTGSIANTTYHVWLINRPDTNVTDVLFSASASAPTLPTNYTKKKAIGSIVRAGATILGFKQRGNEFWLDAPVLDYTSGDVDTTAQTITLASIPTGVKFKAFIYLAIADNSNFVYLSSLDQTDMTPSATVAPLCTVGGNAAPEVSEGMVWTDVSARIRGRQSVDTTVGFRIATLGWTDPRF